LENDEIMLVQPRRTPFLGIPSVVLTSSLLVALKRAGLLVMRRGCRLGDGQSYCSCLELPPFAATAMYSQAQALEVCHRLVDVIL